MPSGVYFRTNKHLQILARARTLIKRKPLSKETKRKIGLANRGVWIKYKCDYCGGENEEKQSHYKQSKRHFCSQGCHSAYRRDIMPPDEQPAWQGGISNTEAHRRWKRKNPERMAFLKARRYAREKGAEGSHTFEEWQELKKKCKNCCVTCGKRKKLTKDHIIPLSEGGTDYISNIQPLCRNCNSQKWKHKTRLF